MFIISLTANNVVNDGTNSNLLYRFPTSVNLTDKYIAVSSVSMFYSWFNITSAYANNTFTYTWTAGVTTTTYTITIPDGLYQIADINNYIQFVCIANGTYWSNGGLNYYPLELIVNAQRYAIQLNTYLIPISLPSGATIPSNFPGWPTTTQNSVVVIPANFSSIIGYAVNFTSPANVSNAYTSTVSYIAKNSIGTISIISTVAPNVQPNSSVYITCNGINNPYTQPGSIIYCLNPSVAVGEQIIEKPPNFNWCKMIGGSYSSLSVSIVSIGLQQLYLKDPNMVIILSIRDKDESFLGTK
jgi:hypothetical protein